MDGFVQVALEILERHGYPTEHLAYLGAGEQSVCYGAGDVALLIRRGADIPDAWPANPYPLQQWLTGQAVRAGVRTAEILATGERPYAYALMRRAQGVNAEVYEGASQAQIAEWYRQLGAQTRKINGIRTVGFGEFVPDGQGGYVGRYATWSAYLDACIARYLFQGALSPAERSVRDLFLAQDILGARELEQVADRLDRAKDWGTQSVLVHYDNRLPNLTVDGGEVTLLDWGLSFAGIGLPQEMIKVTEAPASLPQHSPMSAFLEGYGLPQGAWAEATDSGTLMLVLDGLAMSQAWARAGDPAYLPGIRAWLQSIKRICRTW